MDPYELMDKPFSLEEHKKYGRYLDLEVLISPSGEIEYAIPSHQEGLIKKAMDRNGWTRDELMTACPQEYYASFLEWLIRVSGGYIPVWPQGIIRHPVTRQQKAALRKLKMAGLYHGIVPRGDLVIN